VQALLAQLWAKAYGIEKPSNRRADRTMSTRDRGHRVAASIGQSGHRPVYYWLWWIGLGN
jgi:hypothetical protein